MSSTFEEMRSGLQEIRKVVEQMEDKDKRDRLIALLWDVRTALDEYGGIHHMMAPRILERGYIHAKD